MISVRKFALGASALVLLTPLAAGATEPTYKNHGECVSSTAKGGEARSAAARSGCGKEDDVVTPPDSDLVAPVINNILIYRTNTIDWKQYGFTWGVTTTNASLVDLTWDFGDGNTLSSLAPVRHTYAEGGTYTVTLTATDSNGLTDVEQRTFTVDPNTPSCVTGTGCAG